MVSLLSPRIYFYFLSTKNQSQSAGFVQSIARADEAVVPFKAYYTGSPVGIFDPSCNLPYGCIHQTFEFDGNATHLGLSHFSGIGNTYPFPLPLTQNGDMVFTAADGDQLFGYYIGGGTFTSPTSVEFGGDFWITGGTGRFEGVTGDGVYWGTASTATPTWGKLYFDGLLYK